MIGILGDIPFTVSFDGKNMKVLNFKNLKRSGGANYEQHKRRGHKPSLELIDISTEKIGLDISLRSDLGVRPKELLSKLIAYVNLGKVLDVVLGPELLGQFVILSYDAGYEHITGTGGVRKIDVSLSLEEYTEEIISNIEIKKTEKKIVHDDFNQGAISQ